MRIEYGRVRGEEPQSLRFRSMKPGAVDEFLASATGAVSGGIAGRPYLDIIVGMIPHRLEFDTEVERRQVISQVRARGIPIHRDVEMVAVLVAAFALTIAAVAYAMWAAL